MSEAGAEGGRARDLLSRASETLFASLDSKETVRRLADLAVPALADWCSVDMVRPDGTYARLAVAHPDPALVTVAEEVWRLYPPSPDDPGGLPQVLRSGEAQLIETIPEEAIVAGARDPRHLDLLQRLGLGGASGMVVPLRGKERVLGALSLVNLAGRKKFDRAELELLEELGRVAAVAVENAYLFEETAMARAQAERSEQAFRDLIDYLPALAWTARPDGVIDYYNRGWYAYTGTTPEQMWGWGWKSVHDPTRVEGVVERWSASLLSGEPFEMEFPLRGKDGAYRWFLTRAVPQRDESGSILRWFGTNIDIDDIRAARALAEAVAEQSRDTAARLSALGDALRSSEARAAALEREREHAWKRGS